MQEKSELKMVMRRRKFRDYSSTGFVRLIYSNDLKAMMILCVGLEPSYFCISSLNSHKITWGS